MANRIEAYEPANYSDLNGQSVAPGDIVAITLQGHGWVHLTLAQGPRIELPIRTLFQRDMFRAAVWNQAHAVMLIPGGQAIWLHWIAKRLSAFGIEVKLATKAPRYHEAAEEEPDD
jgi:hypothetical protein